jgi:predicted small integral membrane protein
VDGAVLAFTLRVAGLIGPVFGLLPARSATRSNIGGALQPRTRVRGPRHRLQGLLVTAKVALAMLLLVGAGLMLETFVRLARVDPGFAPEHVLTFNVSVLFAALALLLSAIGVYGIRPHSVAGRLPEVGIRKARGAARRDVLLLVLLQGAQRALSGSDSGRPRRRPHTPALGALLPGEPYGPPRPRGASASVITDVGRVAAGPSWARRRDVRRPF